MKYLAAYMLASASGKVTAEKITAIIKAGGGDAEPEKVELVIKELAGKDVQALIQSGRAKFGGGGAAPAAKAPAEKAGKEEPKKAADKKPEPAKKPEPTPAPAEEEEAEGFSMDLFE